MKYEFEDELSDYGRGSSRFKTASWIVAMTAGAAFYAFAAIPAIRYMLGY